jgi:DNA-directed DNA polymerase III PolC
LTHLDVRSWYSFHDGVSPPGALCAAAAELGFTALGLCDVDGTYGLIEFYRHALKHQLKPVLGLALTDPGWGNRLAGRNTRPATEAGASAIHAGGFAGQDGPPPVAARVFARDHTGYSQLCELAAWRQGVHPEHACPAHGGRGGPGVGAGGPAPAAEWRARHSTPPFSLADALARLADRCFIATGHAELARALARRLGPRRLCICLDPDYGERYSARRHQQKRLAQSLGLRLLACPDVRFVRPQDQPLHQLLRAIGQNAPYEYAQGVVPRHHYLSSRFELEPLYHDAPAALALAGQLAEQCTVEFELGQWRFPEYEPPGAPALTRAAAAKMLYELCESCIAPRYGRPAWSTAHQQRLEHELDVIYQHSFTSYFLACHDIVTEARRRRMPSLGRGSAGNSIVSYLLGITPVDPLAYDLYFERFINPQRESPPDIDLDFDWRRRDEIIEYVYQRWGRARVAMISTYQTFQGRGAWRETAKAFCLPPREIEAVSRRLPWIRAEGLKQLASYPELQGLDLSDGAVQRCLALASRLGGIPRHLGIHAGGIVIAPGRITDYTGLQGSAKGPVVTQYDMHGVEAAGLIKIDLLGNRSLGVLTDTVKALNARGVKPPISDYRSLQHDPATRELIRQGRTLGCFYIESPAMRQLLKRLDTTTFTGLTAASSVIRPGVAESGMMQEYIRRERGLARTQETHPLLEKLLCETHGVMIYQEDVIKVAHLVAGFSHAEADILRRGMSGKLRSHDVLNQLRERFVTGCKAHGVELDAALQIWRQIASFSAYSFCKAHSASFATLSYQVAYLKAHHPAEFLAAVISNGGGFYGAHAYLSECRRLGLSVLPPDINLSELSCTAERTGARAAGAEPDAVRLGLGWIKGVARTLLQQIPQRRHSGGPFASLQDFIRRLRPGQAALRVLILSGALDSLGLTRPELMRLAGLEYMRVRDDAPEVLPGLADERPASARAQVGATTEFPLAQLCRLDLEHLGLLLHGHPLDYVNGQARGTIPSVELAGQAGRTVALLGVPIAYKRVLIKRRGPDEDWLSFAGENADAPPSVDEDTEEDGRTNVAVELGLVRADGGGAGGQAARPGGGAMLMLSLEDRHGTFEAVLFPREYARFAAALRSGAQAYRLTGKADEVLGAFTLRVLALAPVVPEYLAT